MHLASFIYLGGCTAQFCFLNIFPVMMVGCKMVSRQAVLVLPKGVKTFKTNLLGMWNRCGLLLGVIGVGERSTYFTFMPALIVNSVRPTALNTEISLQRR